MCSDRPPGGRDRSSLYVDSTPGQPTRALSPLLTLALAVICLEACEPLRTRGRRGAGHREAEGERALLRVVLRVFEQSLDLRGSHHGCSVDSTSCEGHVPCFTSYLRPIPVKPRSIRVIEGLIYLVWI